MLVIICTKYGKNPSGTVDATEWTRFSRPRPNDLEDIDQGQRSLYATYPLILVIICAKYGKNPSRTVDFFFKVKAEKFQKFAKNANLKILKKKYYATHSLVIVIIYAKYKKNPSRTADATERKLFSKSGPNDIEDIGQGLGSSHATHPLMLLIICTKYGKNPSWTVDATGRTRKVNGQTDRQTGWIQYTPLNFVVWGIKTVWQMDECTEEHKRTFLCPPPTLLVGTISTWNCGRPLLHFTVIDYKHGSQIPWIIQISMISIPDNMISQPNYTLSMWPRLAWDR